MFGQALEEHKRMRICMNFITGRRYTGRERETKITEQMKQNYITQSNKTTKENAMLFDLKERMQYGRLSVHSDYRVG